MPDLLPSEAAWRDLTLPLDALLRPVLRWTVYLGVLLFVPYVLVWGWPAIHLDWPSALLTVPAGVAGFVAVYAVSAVLHEGLHALVMVTAGVPWRSIRFGVRWRDGVAYVHTDRPMTARAYRVVLAVPGLLQGVLPALAGLFYGNGWLLLYGYVMLVSSLGDAVMLRLLAPLDGATLVRDHPTELGCQVDGVAR
ncbi:DUF3267 domain-containing protein [Rhodocaloribacter litoris]|uniref:DUF3267 domain-containing protein n=1 Tax=Rhodocaloribacter litoris TaxID=2558931 RepID=UPI00141E15B2|nr:DUF3267 domain-containing protein [Rhodocaloribacter litoris]QXD13830.1 DUF3267 domain-containing protein [Rhodocaloribacter litoris]